MIEGTAYEAEDGWTFIAHRNLATQTYKVSWRSPEGRRGIIRDRMTIEMIEEFSAELDWQRGVVEMRARKAS